MYLYTGNDKILHFDPTKNKDKYNFFLKILLIITVCFLIYFFKLKATSKVKENYIRFPHPKLYFILNYVLLGQFYTLSHMRFGMYFLIS